MPRTISSGVLQELDKAKVAVAYLVEASFDSGTERMWTGPFSLDWDGETWEAVGNLIGISPHTETIEVSAQPITITLSGVPASFITLALDENYQNRKVKLYMAFLDQASPPSVISEPILVDTYLADQMIIEDGSDAASISLVCENRIAILDKASNRRLTHQDQQMIFPGDLGLEYVVNANKKKDLGFGGRIPDGGIPEDPIRPDGP